jgi:hypothetical protein
LQGSIYTLSLPPSLLPYLDLRAVAAVTIHRSLHTDSSRQNIIISKKNVMNQSIIQAEKASFRVGKVRAIDFCKELRESKEQKDKANVHSLSVSLRAWCKTLRIRSSKSEKLALQSPISAVALAKLKIK